MTVGGLIELLRALPQAAPVAIGYTVEDGDWSEERTNALADVLTEDGTVVLYR